MEGARAQRTSWDFEKEARERCERIKQGKQSPSQSAQPTAPPQGGAKPSAEVAAVEKSEPGMANDFSGTATGEARAQAPDTSSTAEAVPLPLKGKALVRTRLGGCDMTPQPSPAVTPHPSPAVTPSPPGEGLTGEEQIGERERLQMPPALMPTCMSQEAWRNMERAAARGLMPDAAVTPRLRMLYFTMLGLYAAVAAGVMPAAIAKAEKWMAIEAYNRLEADAALFRHTGEFYKNVEAACTAYAKKACFANAEAMHKAVCNALPKVKHEEKDFEQSGGGPGDAE